MLSTKSNVTEPLSAVTAVGVIFLSLLTVDSFTLIPVAVTFANLYEFVSYGEEPS